MDSSNKNVKNISNMFGANPFESPTHPARNTNQGNNATEIFRLNDYDSNIINKQVPFEGETPTTEVKTTLNNAQHNETKKANTLTKMAKFLTERVLPKFSGRYRTILTLNESLETFNEINRNIDELIKIKSAPYGEAIQNEAKLTAYIIQANQIQSQISRNLSKIK